MSDDGFLSRWSRRKRAEARGEALEPAPRRGSADASDATEAARATGAPDGVPSVIGRTVAATSRDVAADPASDGAPVAAATPDSPSPAAALPDPATLTPDADFTPFMRAGVDAGTRNAALHRLFADPHFNVMDGLDIYIDDYSKPDPVTPALLATMRQAHALGLFDAPERDDAAPHPERPHGDHPDGMHRNPASCAERATDPARPVMDAATPHAAPDIAGPGAPPPSDIP